MSFDPGNYRDRTTETVLRNMFDGLVTRTPYGQVVLEAAQSAVLLDENTWEFVLKPGIKFHNGDLLTAEDVKFSFNRIISEKGIDFPVPHISPRKSLLGPLESVEVVDDLTVRLHFNSPWPVAMQMLVHQGIVPRKYFERVGNEGFVNAPVGCGPFKFVEGSLNDRIVMKRFDDYYGGAEALPPVGPAQVENLVFEVIPNGMDRVLSLQIGKVHIIQEVPFQATPILETTPYIRVKSGPGTRPIWLELNVNRPPFNNLQVRKALNFAIDTSLINKNALNSKGIPLHGPLSPFNDFCDPMISKEKSSLKEALELLSEAGWRDSNGDGILDKDGEQFSFVLDIRQHHRDVASEVVRQLKSLGIIAQIEIWPDFSLLRSALLKGSRTAFLGDWGDSAFDPIGFIEAKCHSFSEDSSYGRGNYSGYSNSRIDDLIKAGEREPSTEVRQKIYSEIQQILIQDLSAIFLVLPNTSEACSMKVQNWMVSADGRLNMHDVWISR